MSGCEGRKGSSRPCRLTNLGKEEIWSGFDISAGDELCCDLGCREEWETRQGAGVMVVFDIEFWCFGGHFEVSRMSLMLFGAFDPSLQL